MIDRSGNILKTILVIIYVAISAVFVTPFGVPGFLLYLLGLRRPMSVYLYWICIAWGRALIKLTGCKVTVRGGENIPLRGGLCFVCNHSSMMDIVLLLAYSRRLFGFIAKKELIFLPVFNIWIYMLGGLFINRKNPRKALETINSGIARIKKGGAMVIFPEGHRSDGQNLLPFHPGSFKLATQSGAVIVPVALKGTREIYEKNRRFTPCSLGVTFCKPINTADIPVEDRKQVLADRIYNIIKSELRLT
jgi:1-acyl-sn-glycerol-3-phosphate acyltransferase